MSEGLKDWSDFEAARLSGKDALREFMKRKVTQNFTYGEFFVNRAWAELDIVDLQIFLNIRRLAVLLQERRTVLGKVFRITSGWRTPSANRANGGSYNSLHLTGRAVDLVVDGLTSREAFEQLKVTVKGKPGFELICYPPDEFSRGHVHFGFRNGKSWVDGHGRRPGMQA